MSNKKIILISIGCFVGFLLLVFILEYFHLGMFGFFEPKKEAIRRNVFEETKSYVHGKVQDLASYYGQYQSAKSGDRPAIAEVIKMRFAEFDENKIKNQKLKEFLVEVRGF